MAIYRIKTSAWDEEGFMLSTELTKEQIESVIEPMVKKERDEFYFYTNEDYYWSLKETFPKKHIEIYEDGGIEEIIF